MLAEDDADDADPVADAVEDAANVTPPKKSSRYRLLFLLLALLALAALVSALLPTIGGFRTLLPSLRQTRGGFILAAIACQGLMYVGVAGILRAGVAGAQEDHEDASANAPVLPSVFEPRFVGAAAAFLWCNRAIPGPAVAGLATLVFVLGRRGVSAASAQAAAATFYLADYVSFATVSLVLLVTLALRGGLAGLNTTVLGLALGAILLAMSATIVLLRSPRLVAHLAERAAARLARLLRRRDADILARSARTLVDGFYERWRRVAAHPTALVSACVWGLFMHVGEIATVWCAALAFEAARGTNLLTLIIACGAAYVAGNLAAIVSFLPAGLGAFEVAMGATLHIVGGISVSQAALGTLLYRLLSVWLPLPFLFQTARQALRSAARVVRG